MAGKRTTRNERTMTDFRDGSFADRGFKHAARSRNGDAWVIDHVYADGGSKQVRAEILNKKIGQHRTIQPCSR